MPIASCSKCQKAVIYRTKLPKYCKNCQPKSSRKHKHYGRSKLESTTMKILNEILPDAEYIDNGYYSWLISPKGSPLQLDRFYPELKIAVEVQGQQHIIYQPYIHKTKADFEYLQKCDKLKAALCKRKGIRLIPVLYNMIINKENLLTLLDN